MGHALVDEAEPNVSVSGCVQRSRSGDLGLLPLSFRAVGEHVVGVSRPHDAGPGEGQCDAGGIDGDPAASPLFGDVGGGAGAAGGIEDEVAGVGGHEDAAFDDLGKRLYYVELVGRKACNAGVNPVVCIGHNREIMKETEVAQRVADEEYSPALVDPLHPGHGGFPVKSLWWNERFFSVNKALG